MKSISLKCLLICLLVALAACVPGELGQNASSSPSSPTRPPDTAYPSPVQPMTVTPSNSPTPRQTLAPSLTPSQLPYPTLTATPILRVSQIRMFDADNGWAGYSEPYFPPKPKKILRTTGGIRTWTGVTTPISGDNTDIGAVFFFDADRAIAVSHRSYLPESTLVEVTPWLTSDGGQTWQAGETFQSRATFFRPIQLSFLDPNYGWMLGESDGGMGNVLVHFFETQDGGLHWEMVYDTADHISDSHDIWMNGIYPYPNHFTFISKTAGFFLDWRLYRSQDGGRTWVPRPAPVVLGTVFFLDTDTGWLLGKSDPDPAAPAQLYQTTDGGKTWAQIAADCPLPLGSEMQFVDPQIGFAFFPSALADFYQDFDAQIQTANKKSTLFYTEDGGHLWMEVAPNLAP